MLVEHNTEMRRLIKSMIRKFVDEVVESDGDADAVRMYRDAQPDWVVIDIFRTPDNGITLARSIRDADADAKIVFVSNYTDDRTRQWAVAAGGRGFFGKDDLLGLVDFLKNEKGKD